jgi:hypothetical protein
MLPPYNGSRPTPKLEGGIPIKKVQDRIEGKPCFCSAWNGTSLAASFMREVPHGHRPPWFLPSHLPGSRLVARCLPYWCCPAVLDWACAGRPGARAGPTPSCLCPGSQSTEKMQSKQAGQQTAACSRQDCSQRRAPQHSSVRPSSSQLLRGMPSRGRVSRLLASLAAPPVAHGDRPSTRAVSPRREHEHQQRNTLLDPLSLSLPTGGQGKGQGLSCSQLASSTQQTPDCLVGHAVISGHLAQGLVVLKHTAHHLRPFLSGKTLFRLLWAWTTLCAGERRKTAKLLLEREEPLSELAVRGEKMDEHW